MIKATEKDLKAYAENGYTVIRLGKFALVRLYSKNYSTSFLKRHCFLYTIAKIVLDK